MGGTHSVALCVLARIRVAGQQAGRDCSPPSTHQRHSGVCESALLLHIVITASWTFESRSMARRELTSCDGGRAQTRSRGSGRRGPVFSSSLQEDRRSEHVYLRSIDLQQSNSEAHTTSEQARERSGNGRTGSTTVEV